MQSFPKAVAGSAEVVADGDAIEAGVDAAEENVEVGGDDVRHGLAVAGGNLLFGGAFRFFGHERMGQRYMIISLETILDAASDRPTEYPL